MKGWYGNKVAHSLASKGIKTRPDFFKKIPSYSSISEVYEILNKEQLNQYKELRDKYIHIAHNVTNKYTQKWGDCYTVNSTVAYWLRKHGFPVRILQIFGEFDKEIYDSEMGWTTRDAHVVVWYAETDIPEFDDGDVSIDWEDIEDFSSVLDEWGATMVSYDVQDDLGGEEDKILMNLLDIELEKIR